MLCGREREIPSIDESIEQAPLRSLVARGTSLALVRIGQTKTEVVLGPCLASAL